MIFDEMMWVLLAAAVVLGTPVMALAGFVLSRDAAGDLVRDKDGLTAGLAALAMVAGLLPIPMRASLAARSSRFSPSTST